MSIDQKPILHGRDHSPGGADPIPDLTGGIDFDTYPQAGQWLYIETDGPDTSPSGFGMEFFDQGENGIDLTSGNCHLKLNDFSSGDVDLTTTAGDVTIGASSGQVEVGAGVGGVFLHTTGGTATLEADDSGGNPGNVLIHGDNQVLIERGSTTITLDVGGAPDLEVFSAIPTVKLSSTSATELFRITDVSDNPLLEVRADGTFHIKTGAAWVADL